MKNIRFGSKKKVIVLSIILYGVMLHLALSPHNNIVHRHFKLRNKYTNISSSTLNLFPYMHSDSLSNPFCFNT